MSYLGHAGHIATHHEAHVITAVIIDLDWPAIIGVSERPDLGGLSSLSAKNISVRARPKSLLHLPPSRPTEGRFAVVTDAGRDAVDAAALLTRAPTADGEVVWS